MHPAVVAFAEKHVYLVSSLAALVLFSGLLGAIGREWRRTTVTSAALSMPLALMGLLLVPSYWRPVGILQTPVLLEDLLFMFNAGLCAWVSGSWPYRDRLTLGAVRTRGFARRCAAAIGLLLAGAALLYRLEVKLGLAIPLVWVTSAAMLLRLRPDLRGLMAVASVTFGALYFAVTACIFAAAPGFTLAWNHHNLLGWTVLNVPVDEVVWAMGFGAVWPAFLVYATDGRIRAPEESEPAARCERVPLEAQRR